MTFPGHFRPRLVDALRGYGRERLTHDLGAGLTVGIVALPLAMAFAIASGLKPEAGLWTAIIAGFLISALGGSHVQIGGPAGAFIVVVYGIVERHGLANLLIATACSGVLLFLLGFFRLGQLVRYVPVSIVIGFTNGIAVLIALSQLRDLLGLQVERMPADFFAQMATIGRHLDTLNPWALALGVLTLLLLGLWRRLLAPRPLAPVAGRSALQALPGLRRALHTGARIPGPVVALVTLTGLAWALTLPVETIGTRFGSIPQGLPAFRLPHFSWEAVKQLVTPVLTLTVLGAIESLLCARVADQVSRLPRHDPNQELMAQGIANAVVPFFGGMPATGTIARTVTNVRAGATSPVAGMVHAAVIALVVLLAAPLALHIPLAVLAGILLYVAWNMGEWHEFARLRHFSNHYRLLLLGTFVLTVVFDLTVAVEVGLLLACFLFVRRMSSLFRADPVNGGDAEPLTGPAAHAGEPMAAQAPATPPDAERRWRLYGALFFGAVARADALLQAAEAEPAGTRMVLDCAHLVALDTTGLDLLRQLQQTLQSRGGTLVLENLHEQPRSLVERSGFAAELGMVGETGGPGSPAADGASAAQS